MFPFLFSSINNVLDENNDAKRGYDVSNMSIYPLFACLQLSHDQAFLNTMLNNIDINVIH